MYKEAHNTQYYIEPANYILFLSLGGLTTVVPWCWPCISSTSESCGGSIQSMYVYLLYYYYLKYSIHMLHMYKYMYICISACQFFIGLLFICKCYIHVHVHRTKFQHVRFGVKFDCVSFIIASIHVCLYLHFSRCIALKSEKTKALYY